jgi:hypothetical protein
LQDSLHGQDVAFQTAFQGGVDMTPKGVPKVTNFSDTIKKHEADCECGKCQAFYNWWIGQGYNLLHKKYHDLSTSAFELGFEAGQKEAEEKSIVCTCAVSDGIHQCPFHHVLTGSATEKLIQHKAYLSALSDVKKIIDAQARTKYSCAWVKAFEFNARTSSEAFRPRRPSKEGREGGG